jgi:hypothetical protein
VKIEAHGASHTPRTVAWNEKRSKRSEELAW